MNWRNWIYTSNSKLAFSTSFYWTSSCQAPCISQFCLPVVTSFAASSALESKLQKYSKELRQFQEKQQIYFFLMWNSKTCNFVRHHCINSNLVANLKLHVEFQQKCNFPTRSLWHKCVEGVKLIEKLLITRTMRSFQFKRVASKSIFGAKKKVWMSVFVPNI